MSMTSFWQSLRNVWRKPSPLNACSLWSVSSPRLIRKAVFFDEAAAHAYAARFEGRVQRGQRVYQANRPLMDYDEDYMEGMLPYPLAHGVSSDIPLAFAQFKRNPRMQNALAVLDLAFSAQDTSTAVELINSQRGSTYSYHDDESIVWEWELCFALGSRDPNQLQWLVECDPQFADDLDKNKHVMHEWVLNSRFDLAETYWPWTSQHVLGISLDPTDSRWLSSEKDNPAQIDISTETLGFFIAQLHEPAALMFMASALNSGSRIIEALRNMDSPMEDIFGHYTRVLHKNETPRTAEARMLKTFQSLGLHPVEMYAMARSANVDQAPSELLVPPMELLRY